MELLLLVPVPIGRLLLMLIQSMWRKNLHLPQLVGVDNILEFEMKGGDVMVLKFFVKTDKDGNEINSWYYETWKRVKMPPVYPKDLVR